MEIKILNERLTSLISLNEKLSATATKVVKEEIVSETQPSVVVESICHQISQLPKTAQVRVQLSKALREVGWGNLFQNMPTKLPNLKQKLKLSANAKNIKDAKTQKRPTEITPLNIKLLNLLIESGLGNEQQEQQEGIVHLSEFAAGTDE